MAQHNNDRSSTGGEANSLAVGRLLIPVIVSDVVRHRKEQRLTHRRVRGAPAADIVPEDAIEGVRWRFVGPVETHARGRQRRATACRGICSSNVAYACIRLVEALDWRDGSAGSEVRLLIGLDEGGVH